MADFDDDQSLLGRVRFPFAYDARKHGLSSNPVEFADEKINAMTNVELLQAIDYAICQPRMAAEKK